MLCPNCKRSGVVEITLTISSHPVTVQNCSGCDSRWWQSDGEAVPLRKVLALAAKG